MDYYVNTIPTQDDLIQHKLGRKIYKNIDFQYRLDYLKKCIRSMAQALLRRRQQSLKNVLPDLEINQHQIFDVWSVMKHLKINDFDHSTQRYPTEQMRKKSSK